MADRSTPDTASPFDLRPLHDAMKGMLTDIEGVEPTEISRDELVARLLSSLDRADDAIDLAKRFRLRIQHCLRSQGELDGGVETPADALGRAGVDVHSPHFKQTCLRTLHECDEKLRGMGVTPAFLLCVDTVIHDTARLALDRDSAFFEAFNKTMSTKAGAMHALVDLEGRERQQGAACGVRYEDDPGPACRTLSEV